WMCEMLATLGVHVTPQQMRHAEVRGRRMYDLAATHPRRLALGEPHHPLGSIAPSDAYFSGMLEAVGCRHPVLEEALGHFHARQEPPSLLWGRPAEGARAALDGVYGLGLRACCVSNSDGRAEHHLVVCGVRAGLEFVVDSHIEGVEKPDPRLFGIALERLHVSPDRAVYVGDIRSIDEAGSRAAGMHFVLIDPAGDYAAPGTHAVRAIGELPQYLAEHFTVHAQQGRGPLHP
ncbi:MAG: HAD family hydrolase, partial [Candidatus Eisenbacteria bacterium]